MGGFGEQSGTRSGEQNSSHDAHSDGWMGNFDHARSHSAAPSRIPRTGKGKQTKIPDITRELGVVNVLEGSIRRSGDHLRVTAQPLGARAKPLGLAATTTFTTRSRSARSTVRWRSNEQRRSNAEGRQHSEHADETRCQKGVERLGNATKAIEPTQRKHALADVSTQLRLIVSV